MVELPDDCIALVVTSPPYFADKEYEVEDTGQSVHGNYATHLTVIGRVLKECHRVLEPGGRIAVNIANLGRAPFVGQVQDVTKILVAVGFLPRGEVVWIKGKGAAGNTAWGSYRKVSNPQFRDITERVIVASKERFDRALNPEMRERRGLPHKNTITRADFLAATMDTWYMTPKQARNVNHPAPFPVELPRRFIELFTYEGDVVLDPYMGSGTTAVAAVRAGRHYVGYDLDKEYIDIAKGRVRKAQDDRRPVVTANNALMATVREHVEWERSKVCPTDGPPGGTTTSNPAPVVDALRMLPGWDRLKKSLLDRARSEGGVVRVEVEDVAERYRGRPDAMVVDTAMSYLSDYDRKVRRPVLAWSRSRKPVSLARLGQRGPTAFTRFTAKEKQAPLVQALARELSKQIQGFGYSEQEGLEAWVQAAEELRFAPDLDSVGRVPGLMPAQWAHLRTLLGADAAVPTESAISDLEDLATS